jgi:hypothetical protein
MRLASVSTSDLVRCLPIRRSRSLSLDDDPRRCRRRPEYDPKAKSLRQREMAKVTELEAAGHRVPITTLQRQRRRYETGGLWGWEARDSGDPRCRRGGRIRDWWRRSVGR